MPVPRAVRPHACVPATALLVACALLATATVDSADPKRGDPSSWPWFNASLPFDQRAAMLVAAMTDAEVFNQTTKEADAIPRLGVPSYSYWAEAAHGVAGAGLATVFPGSTMRAAGFDVASEQVMGTMIGMEARAKHANRVATHGVSDDMYALTLYAPVVNIVRDPRWGRAQETYGECPFVSGAMGAAFVQGVQANASAPPTRYLLASAMAKHFVAYNLESNFIGGGTNGNYRMQYDGNASAADLAQSYAPQFQALVAGAGAATVMCSYQAQAGIPMCASPLLKSILRVEYGFDGPVFSDGGAVHNIYSQHNYTKDLPHAAAVAMNAGVDLNSGGKNSDFGYYYLPQAVQAGLTGMARVRQAVQRLMLLRMRLGMFDPPHMVPFAAPPMSIVASAPHVAMARRLAQQGIVLLRNDGGTLPLREGVDPSALSSQGISSIAVIGPNANRSAALLGSYTGCRTPFDGPITPECALVTPLQGITAATHSWKQPPAVSLYPGSSINTSLPGGVAAAAAGAAASDVAVLVLGLSTDGVGNPVELEGEAHDRVTVELPAAQQLLLQGVCNATGSAERGPRVIVVLINGGPVAAVEAATGGCVHAVVEAWYPGQAGGAALADVLFGAVTPSGKLPVTFPADDAQLGADYYNLSLAAAPFGRTYRYYNHTGTAPASLYPFGYGLSYTDFAYSEMTATVSSGMLRASATVTNVAAVSHTSAGAGACADEVSFMYVGLRLNSSADRFAGARAIPLYELKAFTRSAAPLCPGASARVEFSVPVATALRLMDVDGAMRVIPGEYDVWVGGRAPGGLGVGGDAAAAKALSGVPEAPLHAVVTVAGE